MKIPVFLKVWLLVFHCLITKEFILLSCRHLFFPSKVYEHHIEYDVIPQGHKSGFPDKSDLVKTFM